MDTKVKTDQGDFSDPLRVLESIMNNPKFETSTRIDAAAKLASFLYAKPRCEED
ncbi:hypothetical protein [Serratia fonticola]|uniref:hypothetical protein n=1 Tax=Serratia fonticola TaxID=47917 RepID=UPI00137724D1|nr:hypothetical protein [Serratia fonticola]NCG50251.1 hypothetical protein [Serratia fonticola]